MPCIPYVKLDQDQRCIGYVSGCAAPEHYWPLLYALAQQGGDEPAEILIDGIEHGAIGMLSVVLGSLH